MGILPMYSSKTTGETPVGLTAKMAVLLELKDPDGGTNLMDVAGGFR